MHHLFTAALLTASGPARAQSPWIPGGTPGVPGSSPPSSSAGEATSDPSGPTLVCQSSTLGQIALDGFTATRFCTRLVHCPVDAAGADAARPVDTPNLDQDSQLQSRIIDCAGICRCYVPPPPTPTPTPTPSNFGGGPGSAEFRDGVLNMLGFLKVRR